jgi:hypothetical protein
MTNVNPKPHSAQKTFAPGSSRGPRSIRTFVDQMARAEDARTRERGDRIRELRAGIPQPRIADQVGVTLRAYQEWEAGGGIGWDNLVNSPKSSASPRNTSNSVSPDAHGPAPTCTALSARSTRFYAQPGWTPRFTRTTLSISPARSPRSSPEDLWTLERTSSSQTTKLLTIPSSRRMPHRQLLELALQESGEAHSRPLADRASALIQEDGKRGLPGCCLHRMLLYDGHVNPWRRTVDQTPAIGGYQSNGRVTLATQSDRLRRLT